MKGTMRERTPGHWELRVYQGRDTNGRPIQASRSFKGGTRQAQSELAKFVAEVEAGSAPLSGTTTVGELLDRWFEHITPMREPGTLRGYASTIRRIKPALGQVKVNKLTALHLDQAYREWLGRGSSPGTIRHTHAVLSAALHQAVRWGLIPRAVTELATLPTMTPPAQQELSPDAVKALIATAEDESPVLAATISLAALTGCRRGELCGLRWSDVDPAGVLHIRRAIKHDVDRAKLVVRTTKTRQERKLALDPVALAILASHRLRVERWAKEAEVEIDPDGYILTPDLTGRAPQKPDTVTSAFARLTARTDIKLRFHDLRHFTATTAIAAGADIRTVAGRLGHANPATTLRIYTHAIEARDRDVAAILGRALSRGPTAEGSSSRSGPGP